VEQLLDTILELIGLVLAEILDPGAVIRVPPSALRARSPRRRPVEFEREEQQMNDAAVSRSETSP